MMCFLACLSATVTAFQQTGLKVISLMTVRLYSHSGDFTFGDEALTCSENTRKCIEQHYYPMFASTELLTTSLVFRSVVLHGQWSWWVTGQAVWSVRHAACARSRHFHIHSGIRILVASLLFCFCFFELCETDDLTRVCLVSQNK